MYISRSGVYDKKDSFHKNSFTLIELLIVVLIISILSAMVVKTYNNAKIKSYISCSIADLKSVSAAIESYRILNNEVPLKYPGLDRNNGIFIELSWNLSPLTFPIAYINEIPYDPFVETYGGAKSLNKMSGFPVNWYSYIGNKVNYSDPICGVWRVWGNGPDRTRQSYPSRPYSVTNGLTSKGDIIFSEKSGFLDKDLRIFCAGDENQYNINE